MKNAYELAENILKSKPDKNIELKSSDSFASIELYGTSACKKVQVYYRHWSLMTHYSCIFFAFFHTVST